MCGGFVIFGVLFFVFGIFGFVLCFECFCEMILLG